MQFEAIASRPVASYLGEETQHLPHYNLLSGSCREQPRKIAYLGIKTKAIL